MFNKKILLVALLLASCAPEQTSSAVTVPDAVTLGISAVLLSLFTAGFTYLFEIARIDLRGFAVGISGAVSLWIVTELQNIINTIPPVHDPLIQTVLTILGVILGGVGALRLLSRTPATLMPGGFSVRARQQ